MILSRVILKLKAKFYHYTGIYLAEKEEAAYVDSKLDYKKPMAQAELNYTKSTIGAIWQIENGFVLPFLGMDVLYQKYMVSRVVRGKNHPITLMYRVRRIFRYMKLAIIEDLERLFKHER